VFCRFIDARIVGIYSTKNATTENLDRVASEE